MNLQCMATKHSMKCLGCHEICPTKNWPKPQKRQGQAGNRNLWHLTNSTCIYFVIMQGKKGRQKKTFYEGMIYYDFIPP